MEFKRCSIIALFLAGKLQSAIFRELQHLGVNKMFVYRTIKRYNETGSIEKRYGGGPPKTATTPAMVKRVRQRLLRKPGQSGTQMAKELNISRRSIQRIFNKALHVKPYKKVKLHHLTEAQKEVRLVKAKELKRQHEAGELPNIIFSDEKVFTVEVHTNTQNESTSLTVRPKICNIGWSPGNKHRHLSWFGPLSAPIFALRSFLLKKE